jgi:hypothetical protein
LFYTATLSALGGIFPYSWSLIQGVLPSGLTLNQASGVISGNLSNAAISTVTVQVSDSESPPVAMSASLTITVDPPPARNAALYVSHSGQSFLDQSGLQIQSDGSLTPLPSSPESAITGGGFAPSPTLPLIFMSGGQSLLVNPDYSLTLYSSATLLGAGISSSVDPAGSNLYLPTITSSGTTVIDVLPANGSQQVLSTIALPDLANNSKLQFTPDGSLGFIATCPSSSANGGTIVSFSRHSDGSLSQLATYTLPTNVCASALAVSPDGRYLATTEIQIYSIAQNGSLTPVLAQSFIFTTQYGTILTPADVIWDSSGAFLIASPGFNDRVSPQGSIAVLSFSGNGVTETTFLVSNVIGVLQRSGSFIYGMELCNTVCAGSFIDGYVLQNGLLTPLPGSPYPYGNSREMVIY